MVALQYSVKESNGVHGHASICSLCLNPDPYAFNLVLTPSAHRTARPAGVGALFMREDDPPAADPATFLQPAWFHKDNAGVLRDHMRYLLCRLLRDRLPQGQGGHEGQAEEGEDPRRAALEAVVAEYEGRPHALGRRYMHPPEYLQYVRRQQQQHEQQQQPGGRPEPEAAQEPDVHPGVLGDSDEAEEEEGGEEGDEEGAHGDRGAREECEAEQVAEMEVEAQADGQHEESREEEEAEEEVELAGAHVKAVLGEESEGEGQQQAVAAASGGKAVGPSFEQRQASPAGHTPWAGRARRAKGGGEGSGEIGAGGPMEDAEGSGPGGVACGSATREGCRGAPLARGGQQGLHRHVPDMGAGMGAGAAGRGVQLLQQQQAAGRAGWRMGQACAVPGSGEVQGPVRAPQGQPCDPGVPPGQCGQNPFRLPVGRAHQAAAGADWPAEDSAELRGRRGARAGEGQQGVCPRQLGGALERLAAAEEGKVEQEQREEQQHSMQQQGEQQSEWQQKKQQAYHQQEQEQEQEKQQQEQKPHQQQQHQNAHVQQRVPEQELLGRGQVHVKQEQHHKQGQAAAAKSAMDMFGYHKAEEVGRPAARAPVGPHRQLAGACGERQVPGEQGRQPQQKQVQERGQGQREQRERELNGPREQEQGQKLLHVQGQDCGHSQGLRREPPLHVGAGGCPEPPDGSQARHEAAQVPPPRDPNACTGSAAARVAVAQEGAAANPGAGGGQRHGQQGGQQGAVEGGGGGEAGLVQQQSAGAGEPGPQGYESSQERQKTGCKRGREVEAGDSGLQAAKRVCGGEAWPQPDGASGGAAAVAADAMLQPCDPAAEDPDVTPGGGSPAVGAGQEPASGGQGRTAGGRQPHGAGPGEPLEPSAKRPRTHGGLTGQAGAAAGTAGVPMASAAGGLEDAPTVTLGCADSAAATAAEEPPAGPWGAGEHEGLDAGPAAAPLPAPSAAPDLVALPAQGQRGSGPPCGSAQPLDLQQEASPTCRCGGAVLTGSSPEARHMGSAAAAPGPAQLPADAAGGAAAPAPTHGAAAAAAPPPAGPGGVMPGASAPAQEQVCAAVTPPTAAVVLDLASGSGLNCRPQPEQLVIAQQLIRVETPERYKVGRLREVGALGRVPATVSQGWLSRTNRHACRVAS